VPAGVCEPESHGGSSAPDSPFQWLCKVSSVPLFSFKKKYPCDQNRSHWREFSDSRAPSLASVCLGWKEWLVLVSLVR